MKFGCLREQQFAHEMFETEDAAGDDPAQVAGEELERSDRGRRSDRFDGARSWRGCAARVVRR
jgi:hypothetical protein